MRADPSAQLKLLEVQELDSRADHLRHQLTSLPEIARLAELDRARSEIDDQARDARILVDDLNAEQKKADRDVEQVKARRKRDQDRIDAGQVTNPKDLERMQHELVSLERRITTLEDEELEVMERLEQAQTDLDRLTHGLGEVDAEVAELTGARDEKSAGLREELEATLSAREPAAAGLPDDLLNLYDKLRGSKAGVGAAMLRGRQCEGCRITIDNAELAVIKQTASDVVVRCEECQRILVRTSESGL